MKVCSKCSMEKSEDCFWKRNNRKCLVNSECKECCSSRRRKFYSENTVEILENRKKYYRENIERFAEYTRKHQKNNKRFREYQNKYLINKRKTHDQKFLARQIVQLALKGKMIFKPSKCTRCVNTQKIEAHHEDYSKPLDILWVCFTCHRLIHKESKI